MKKFIELQNRKGRAVKLEFRRTVTALTSAELAELPENIKFCGYHSIDELIPQENYSSEDVLCCPWSLEQFPGAEGIIGFGRCTGDAAGCANSDFYGDPGERLQYAGRVFKFMLGGPKRLQIGIKAAARPELIGSLDQERGILALRTTPVRHDGKYINIADNDQVSGPYGASDMFSIFNGSQELNFYELETIAPMSISNGVMQPCRLDSVTLIAKGGNAELRSFLEAKYGIAL